MRYIDVFNGDADSLIARHQFRLSFPVPYGKLTLVIAIQFTHGGGRATAAGINNLAAPDIARLVSLLEQTYRTPPASVDEN